MEDDSKLFQEEDEKEVEKKVRRNKSNRGFVSRSEQRVKDRQWSKDNPKDTSDTVDSGKKLEEEKQEEEARAKRREEVMNKYKGNKGFVSRSEQRIRDRQRSQEHAKDTGTPSDKSDKPESGESKEDDSNVAGEGEVKDDEKKVRKKKSKGGFVSRSEQRARDRQRSRDNSKDAGDKVDSGDKPEDGESKDGKKERKNKSNKGFVSRSEKRSRDRQKSKEDAKDAGDSGDKSEKKGEKRKPRGRRKEKPKDTPEVDDDMTRSQAADILQEAFLTLLSTEEDGGDGEGDPVQSEEGGSVPEEQEKGGVEFGQVGLWSNIIWLC